MSIPRADYEFDRAPSGPLKEEAKRERERAVAAYVRKHLVDAKDELRISRYEEAFGILTSLHRHAISRGAEKLDAEEIQPVLQETVLGLVRRMESESRRAVGAVVAFLDAAHDTEARELAAKPFASKAAEHDALATAAGSKGSIPAQYLHRAIADYYGFRRIEETERARREAEMAPLAGLKFEIAPVSSCGAFEFPVLAFGNAHNKDVGHAAQMRVEVQTCSLGKTVSDEVTTATKTYKRTLREGSTTTTKEDGHYEQKSVQDSSGNEIYKTGTGHYVDGQTKTTTTDAVMEDAEVTVQIHRVRRQWDIQAVITVETPLTGPVRVPLTYSEGYDDEQWDVPAEAASQLQQRFDPAKELHQTVDLKKALETALDGAAASARAELSRAFAAKAKGESNPDEQLVLLADSIFAGAADPEAATLLEAKINVPADDILRALGKGDAGTSSLAYKLPDLPPLTDAEVAKTTSKYEMIELRSSSEGTNHFEVMAAIQTSSPTSGVADPSASYGLGVGMRLWGGVDPGRRDNGPLGGLAMDLRLGYAGGMFIDGTLPVLAGYRYQGIGLAATGMFGWNKLGKDAANDLWVRNSPYLGYGLHGSYVSWGSTDVSASWTQIVRSSEWQKTDPFADVIPPVTTDEMRLEFRVSRYYLRTNRYDPDIVKSLTLRYASFTGDRDGRAITLWYGLGLMP